MSKISEKLIFEKPYQDKLKVKYNKALEEAWKGDERMVKYDMNQIAYLVPICNGNYIIKISKVKLDKDFYFGYSDIGQGLSFEENTKRMDEFKKNIEQNFKEKNLSTIDSMIKQLEEIICGHSSIKAMHFVQYYNCPENSILHDFGFDDPWRGRSFTGKGFDLDLRDLKLILEGYKLLREYTIKKINGYLKRYGTNKIYVSSYWIDE